MAKYDISQLQDIGRTLSEVRTGSHSAIEGIMSAFATDAIEKMRDNLLKKGVGTGSGSNLAQSIKPLPIKITDNAVILEIEMADYWDYVNSGVDGLGTKWGSKYLFRRTAKVPTPTGQKNFVQSLQEWTFKNGINTFTFKNERGEYVTKPVRDDDDRERLAFAIMKGVKQKGIEPTHFVDDYLTDNRIDELTNELFEAIAQNFE